MREEAVSAMRTTTKLLFALLLMPALPTTAWAQDVRVIDPNRPQGDLSEPTSDPIQHQVRSGDTLWDLSDSYYGSPWYWPQVWSQNPQVSNPHYIYPGDLIRFGPLKEAAPEAVVEEGEAAEAEGLTVAGARVRFVPSDAERQVYVRYVGFVSDEEVRAAGIVRWSREEREMLGELDEVYIDFERLPRVRPGDRWTIVALEDEVIHPVYRRKIGNKVDILGVVDIRAVTRKLAIGTIVRSYKEISRGAIVIPLVPNFRSVKPRPNPKNVRGYIVDSYLEVRNIGQHQLVYIDKGVREEVEVGNRFHIVRQGDGIHPLNSDDLSMLPWEPIGEVMVVETRDHHCTGIVLGDFTEVVIGDVVEMRPGF
jgi:hypothetical protein